jgi:hypothetical protein
MMPSLKYVATVTVGRKRTNARYFVRDTSDVHALLQQLQAGDAPSVVSE